MEFFTNEYRLEDEVDKLVKWIKEYVMRRASIDNSNDGRVAVEIDVWELFELFEYATMDNVDKYINPIFGVICGDCGCVFDKAKKILQIPNDNYKPFDLVVCYGDDSNNCLDSWTNEIVEHDLKFIHYTN
jgi:hypothetical protein